MKTTHSFKRFMLISTPIFFGVFTIFTAITGCSLFGSNPKAPSKVERAIFDTVTNYVTVTNPVVRIIPVFTTNTVQQSFTVTNVVPGAPPQISQVVTQMQEKVIDHYVTNTVQAVSTNEAYTLTVKPSTKAGEQAIGAAVNAFLPGAGTLVSLGLAAITGLWGYGRSTKLAGVSNTAATLVQEMETVREFIGALPNGANIDSTLTDWLHAHQTETGAVSNVLGLLKNEVSNSDAKVAAQQLIDTINALNSPAATVPIGTVPIPPVKLT